MSISGGSTVPITVAWIVIITAALINLVLMGDGKTLEGGQHRFGRYVDAEETTTAPAAGLVGSAAAGEAP
jgi:hypothetical protein